MIFVTVGSDIPFDRLIKAVDQWASEKNRHDVFAQIGRGGWVPQFIAHTNMLEPSEFKVRLASAQLIVGHAGMGTILSALQISKPILVMPRRGHLGETRNDHQMATARQFLLMGKVNIVLDEEELFASLDHIEHFVSREPITPCASPRLVDSIHAFIHAQ